MDEEVLAAVVEKGLLPSKEVAYWRALVLGRLFRNIETSQRPESVRVLRHRLLVRWTVYRVWAH